MTHDAYPDSQETLERLEQSQKVAATIENAYSLEMARKKALLQCFIAEGLTPPKPETAEPTPTSSAAPPATPARSEDDKEMSDQEAVDLVKVGHEVLL